MRTYFAAGLHLQLRAIADCPRGFRSRIAFAASCHSRLSPRFPEVSQTFCDPLSTGSTLVDILGGSDGSFLEGRRGERPLAPRARMPGIGRTPGGTMAVGTEPTPRSHSAVPEVFDPLALFELIARLQSSATVPMIDIRAYAQWLTS